MASYKKRTVQVNPPVVETTGETVVETELAPLEEGPAPADEAPATLRDAQDTGPLLALATVEEIVVELRDRGFYGVDLRA